MAATDRPASYRAVLAAPEFRRLWAAHLLSVAGDQLARVALTVLVFDRTRSAGLAALTYALTYLPDLVGGAALAHLADRFDRRAVLVGTDLLRAVLVAAMAVPVLPLAVRILLLVAVQLAAVPFQSARSAVLPGILDGDRLTVGIGLMQTTYQAGLAVGFGAGAAVVAGLGPSGALLADAATFALSAALIGTGLGPHPRQPGVHAGRVAVQHLAVRGRQRRQLALDALGREIGADRLVEPHHRRAQHLGHPALGAAARHLHLEQPVLRHRVAVAIEDAVHRVRIDVRHAIGVTPDRDLAIGALRRRRDGLGGLSGGRRHGLRHGLRRHRGQARTGRQKGGRQHMLLH